MANPSTRDWPASVLIAARLLSLAVVCAALYWGQAVLVPLVLAALLTILYLYRQFALGRIREMHGLLYLTPRGGAAHQKPPPGEQ